MKILNPVFRTIKPAHLAIAVHAAGSAVALTIVLAGYTLLGASHSCDETDCIARIEEGKRLIDQSEMLHEILELNECELFEHSQRLERLNALIPYRPESSRFLAQLAKLADSSELDIRNFRPGTPEDKETIKRIKVQLTGAGSWECICRFVHGLHSLPRLTHVSRLSIDPINADQQYPVNMELSIFFAADDSSTRIARND